MEYIKQYIITIVTALIFITAVELISPDKPIKKYIKFVTGLIFLSVMLNPIVYLLTKGETEVIATIRQYENNLTNDLNKTSDNISNEQRENSFKENLNKNCEKSLEDNFKDLKFKPEIQCTFDFEKMTYNIDKVELGVKDNNIKLIEKINISIGQSKEVISEDNPIENQEEIIAYLMDMLKIPRDKIEIYNLDR